jgi:hypothetical protein
MYDPFGSFFCVSEDLMKHTKQALRIAAIFLLINTLPVVAKINGTFGDYEYAFSGKYRPESFYSKNFNLLNNSIDEDQTWYARHIIDIDLDVLYGRQTYKEPVAEFYFTLRNKAIWGDPSSIASTTETDVKILDAVGRPHKHDIPRLFFWMREAWLRLDLAELLHLPFINKHSLTLGSFSFKLGRGIALGDAFAPTNDLLGYYTEFNVDQFAFGGKLSGNVVEGALSYDLYSGILQNKSGNFGDTSSRIYAAEIGHDGVGARGFGHVNFVVAGRLDWTVFDTKTLGILHVEPYGLLNHDPEQKIEFLGDASSRLGTLGLASDYRGSIFEFGFDYAFNLGQQRVRGWDRNQTREENRDGFLAFVNSHVVDQTGKKILFINGSPQQKIIDCTDANETQNGVTIGDFTQQITVCNDANISVCQDADVQLINNNNRFRNAYTNKYKGWMFITDSALWVYRKDLQLSVMAGIASGDDNPNLETKDEDYTGFIPVQEAYSGERVKSAFPLGATGKFRRPLSQPTSIQSPSRFPRAVSRFTDLVFTGAAIKWEPRDWANNILIHPNVLAYWEDKPINKFCAQTGKELEQHASTFLGIEANVFFHYFPIKNMKLFVVSSLFFPGGHYEDIRGKPASPDQAAALAQYQKKELTEIPNIGDDIAFTLNAGFEFRF